MQDGLWGAGWVLGVQCRKGGCRVGAGVQGGRMGGGCPVQGPPRRQGPSPAAVGTLAGRAPSRWCGAGSGSAVPPPAAVPWRKDGSGHGMNGTRRSPSGERGHDLSAVLNRRGDHRGPRSSRVPSLLGPVGECLASPIPLAGRPSAAPGLPWSSVPPQPGGPELLASLSAGGPGHIAGDSSCAPWTPAPSVLSNLCHVSGSCQVCIYPWLPGLLSRSIETSVIPLVPTCACAPS